MTLTCPHTKLGTIYREQCLFTQIGKQKIRAQVVCRIHRTHSVIYSWIYWETCLILGIEIGKVGLVKFVTRRTLNSNILLKKCVTISLFWLNVMLFSHHDFHIFSWTSVDTRSQHTKNRLNSNQRPSPNRFNSLSFDLQILLNLLQPPTVV